MSDEPTDGVLGSLPRTRPHRRSAKRGPAPQQAKPVAATPSEAKLTSAAKPRAKLTPGPAKPSAKPALGPVKPGAKRTQSPATAKSPSGRALSGQTGAPVRSLQSATAPRAASDRSRKPGVTSQAHQQSTPRTDPPAIPRRSAPPAAEPAGAVGTAVQAAAELTEIGLRASARALRGALSRLPRP